MENSVKQTYQLMAIDDLIVGAYQRIIKNNKIKKWSKSFDPMLLGTITVSKRNSRYYVIDGQHRTILAKANGINGLMALVYDGLTYEDEAILFNALNGAHGEKTGLTAFDVMNASVEAKDPDAMELFGIAESCGFKFANHTGNGNICAIKMMKNQIDKRGGKNIKETLLVLRKTWGGESDSCSGKIITGLSEFLQTYQGDENFNEKTFVKQLSKIEPKKLLRDANGDQSTNNAEIKMMNQLLKHYNNRISKKLSNKHFV